ncbi:putative tape measure protein [Folsomia candida]|uniref:Putative tape measure protein n=1 Tax=Folsomia candida TaxID=158441 RepID=A0A226ECM6_FOLCA|nr:putative tape measure protein [Folsomia candida]
MCCSIRAAAFFLSSLHVYFAVTQMVRVLPTAISSLSSRTLEAVMALIFALFFFSSGFMTFRGADEESQVLIAGGGVLLFLILGERFTLMYFGLMLNSTLPEGDFLNPYGDTIPIIFTGSFAYFMYWEFFTILGALIENLFLKVLLYLFYFGVLFGYHKELQENDEDQMSSPIHHHSSRGRSPPPDTMVIP